MSNNNIIVDVSLGQTRVALIEDNELVELYIEDDKYISTAGNIYKGKVLNVFPGMEAAFVDIGKEKNAFLHARDAVISYIHGDEVIEEKVAINDAVKIGQEIIVQVVKEAQGTKGARITTQVTLPGKYLVLIPNVEYIAISRRIEDEKERIKLKSQLEKLRPEGFGLIVRTAALGHTDEEFLQDVDFLVKLWTKILDKAKNSCAPQLIHRDFGLIYRTVRDVFNSYTNKFVINDKQEYANVLELVELTAPTLKHKFEYYNKSFDIFDFYNIGTRISKILARKVWLKSGGHIIIDKTEALTVIDVNTGKFMGNTNLEDTILKINLEAAREIAKQIRLRDIGGIIVIDFIDMLQKESQNILLKALEQYTKRDRTKTQVVGISQLGLVEMTRKKIRQNLSVLLQTQCPCCKGSGRVTFVELIIKEIERKVEKIFNEEIARTVVVEAHPEVIKKIEQNKINFIKNRFDKKVIIRPKFFDSIEEFEVKDIDKADFLC